MDTDVILSKMEAFMRAEAPRLARLESYYLGRHDILREPRDPLKPDNRLVNNFCRSITDCTVGYFMGKPVAYSADDPALMELVTRVSRENSERFVNNALARDLSVCCRAAELLWYDDIGHPRFSPLPAASVMPVYDDGVEPALLAAVRFFRESDADGWTVEIYDDACDAFIEEIKPFVVD